MEIPFSLHENSPIVDLRSRRSVFNE
jgi:hypothetical protein